MASTDLLNRYSELKIATEMIIREIPETIAIVLFGSFASEYATDQSDLDLAILSAAKVDLVALWELSQKIAISIGQDVDLVDLAQASTVFRYQILTSGTCIFCQNEEAFAFFDTTAISMYLDFQEERQAIIDDIKGND